MFSSELGLGKDELWAIMESHMGTKDDEEETYSDSETEGNEQS